jgi:hypothetical protein
VEVPESGANERELLVLWIIWAPMFGFLFFYVFFCHQWGDQIRRTASPNLPLDLMRNILYGIAFFTVFLIHILRKSMITARSGGSGPMSLKSSLLSNRPSFLGQYKKAMVVSLALSESIGIYGFVLFLLGDGFRTLYIFIGISALAMFFYRPKREELEALAIAMQSGQWQRR